MEVDPALLANLVNVVPNLLSAMARRVSQVPPSQQSTQPAKPSFPPASPRPPPQPAPASPSVIVLVPRVPTAENLDEDNLPHGPQDPLCHDKNHPLTYNMIYEMLAMGDKALRKLPMFRSGLRRHR